MWKSVVGHKSSDKVLKSSENSDDLEDAWDTDPDFVVKYRIESNSKIFITLF
jgi:hypothetical protein